MIDFLNHTFNVPQKNRLEGEVSILMVSGLMRLHCRDTVKHGYNKSLTKQSLLKDDISKVLPYNFTYLDDVCLQSNNSKTIHQPQ